MSIHPKSLLFLDGLRGLTAFYVLIYHARQMLWEGYSQGYLSHPHDYGIFDKCLVYLFSMFRYGREAVLFFFVLSGFVIHLRYAVSLKNIFNKSIKFDFFDYIKRRALRLYPPLFFSLILTILFDYLAIVLGYKQSITFTQSHSWLIAIGNILFLMNTYVPVWGTNAPLWSLKFEGWFYILYPLFWFLSKRSILLASLLMVLLFCLSPIDFIWPLKLLRDVFSLMLVWWLGVLLADVYTKRIYINIHYLSWFTLLLPFLILKLFPIFIMPLGWGIFFCGLVSFFLFLQNRGANLSVLNSLKGLGDMSYTLYIIHYPILVFMNGWLISRSIDHNSLPMHFNWVFVGIMVNLSFAYIFHFYIEKPFVSSAKNRIGA